MPSVRTTAAQCPALPDSVSPAFQKIIKVKVIANSLTLKPCSNWVDIQWQNGEKTHYTHVKILKRHREFKASYAAFS